jgi:hypothetical protein
MVSQHLPHAPASIIQESSELKLPLQETAILWMDYYGLLFTPRLFVLTQNCIDLGQACFHWPSPTVIRLHPRVSCRAFLVHREIEPRARLQATRQEQPPLNAILFPPCHCPLPYRFLQSELGTGNDPIANKPTIDTSANTVTHLSCREDAKR